VAEAIDFAALTRRAQITLMRRVARAALDRFGVAVHGLDLLQHFDNTTFAASGSDGSRSVLHVVRHGAAAASPAKHLRRIESELWWLDRLRGDLHLPLPEVVHTPAGDGVVSIAIQGVAMPYLCTLFRWLDGRHVYHRLTPAHLAAVGRLTALLHTHSETLGVPPDFDRPRVDPAGVETEAEMARVVTDRVSPEAAAVMLRALHVVRRAQEVLGERPDTFGLIHADIHQRNYLFRRDGVRLLDFGDCGWGNYLYDLGVTRQQLAGHPRHAELCAAQLAGYREIRELSSRHEELIDAFAMLRELQDLTWLAAVIGDPRNRAWTGAFESRLRDLDRQPAR